MHFNQLSRVFFLATVFFFLGHHPIQAQTELTPSPYTFRDPLDTLIDQHILRPAPSFNPKRFWIATGTGTILYTATSYALWQTWYADFPRSSFQTINDWPEWLQMDKAGHAFTAYQYSKMAYAAANWTGLAPVKSRWTAFGVSTLFQSTLEMMDAYSAEWGFSWTDVAANTVGSGLFLAQDILWNEQRILLKVSNDLRPIPDVPIINGNGVEGNLGDVVRLRYGTGLVERYLKDYNSQTIWISANLKSFSPRSNLPDWLNLAVGYGAEDVYGALGNNWTINGQGFGYAPKRYRQVFLSPDVYFSRIPTRKRWVRFILGTLDFFKLPAPALEYSRGRFRAHWFMW
ncbi:MAG: DUF2279 domain-containing protein [Bacteroidota bacterium]